MSAAETQFLVWSAEGGAGIVFDTGEGMPFGADQVVVAAGDEARVIQWFEAGARQVLVGEAALRDGALVARIAERFGADRIGVYLSGVRAAVNWSLDPYTNADFTCLVTSMPVPRWDVLLAGEPTGTDALWWAEQMITAGASMVVIATEVNEGDLLLAAEAVERIGEALWFAPLGEAPALRAWVELAGAPRFVVHRAMALAPWSDAAA